MTDELINKKCNRLLIIECVGSKAKITRNNKKQAHIYYKCLCDCGNYCEREKSYLKSNRAVSCGCARKDHLLYLKNRLNPNKLKENEAAINRMYDRYILGAKKRNLEFSINKEDFTKLIFNRCYYCNQEPYLKQSLKQSNGNPFVNGIDRVDNSKGYTNENSVTCCKKCNFAKHEMSESDFLKLIEMIFNNRIKNNDL